MEHVACWGSLDWPLSHCSEPNPLLLPPAFALLVLPTRGTISRTPLPVTSQPQINSGVDFSLAEGWGKSFKLEPLFSYLYNGDNNDIDLR